MGEPLEWMLTPDSVGTFIQVGDDAPGFAHRLAGIKRAEKKDQSLCTRRHQHETRADHTRKLESARRRYN